MRRSRDQDVADLLGIAYDTVVQAVLTPRAYTKETDFRSAARPEPEALTRWDRW